MAALGEDLLGTVNKLQDLVFNTIGNDSLDLPQIVRMLNSITIHR
jgi:dynamin 1-like protein